MSWEGLWIGFLFAVLVFVLTLVARAADDLHHWIWHRERREPSEAEKRLAEWGDERMRAGIVCDEPQPKPPKPAAEKRHHPALKNPAELKDVPSEASVGQVAEKPGAYLGWACVPGRWGGPYL